MVVDSGVSIAVHDHIHLRRSRTARLSICPEYIVTRELVESSSHIVRIEFLIELGKSGVDSRLCLLIDSIEYFLSLFFTQRVDISAEERISDFLFLPFDIVFDLGSDIFERIDEKSSRPTTWITDELSLSRIEDLGHEAHDRARGEKLSEIATKSTPKKLLECYPLHVIRGIREVVFFEEIHDLEEARLTDTETIIFFEYLCVFEVFFGLLEEFLIKWRVSLRSGLIIVGPEYFEALFGKK